jgi:hypothetical protein
MAQYAIMQIMFQLFHTYYEYTACGEDGLLGGVGAGGFGGDDGHGTGTASALANVGNAAGAGDLFADAQAALVVVGLLAVQELHAGAIKLEVGDAQAEGCGKCGWGILDGFAAVQGGVFRGFHETLYGFLRDVECLWVRGFADEAAVDAHKHCSFFLLDDRH